MPAYKDKDRGTWYCCFYYTDWQGEQQRKTKRGFTKQKDAKEWERAFLDKLQENPQMTMASLISLYNTLDRLPAVFNILPPLIFYRFKAVMEFFIRVKSIPSTRIAPYLLPTRAQAVKIIRWYKFLIPKSMCRQSLIFFVKL